MSLSTVRFVGGRLAKNISTTAWLIIFNIFLFFIFTIVLAFKPALLSYIELQPSTIIQGKALWTLVTSMFMHQGGFHLFVNMLSLFFIGGFCERLVGKKRFLSLYLAAGIIAALVFVLGAYAGSFVSWGPRVLGGIEDSAAGASGALFGLLGVLAMLLPYHRVYLIVGPLVVLLAQVLIYPLIPAQAGAAFLVFMNILMFVSLFALFSKNPHIRVFAVPLALPMWLAPVIALVPLFLVSFLVRLPIGNTAHLGGLLVGLAYGWYLRLRYPQKILLLRRFFGS